MKRSIFLCLFLTVLAAGLWPSEQPKWATLLTSLESERHILTLSLFSIEKELNTTKKALLDLKSEYSQMENAFSEQRQLLNERKIAYEERKSELKKEKAQLVELVEALELRERQLEKSAGLLMSLGRSFADYQERVENEIQALSTWQGIALIGIPVAILVGGILGAVLLR